MLYSYIILPHFLFYYILISFLFSRLLLYLSIILSSSITDFIHFYFIFPVLPLEVNPLNIVKPKRRNASMFIDVDFVTVTYFNMCT